MKLICTRGAPYEYWDLARRRGYFSVSQHLVILDPDAFKGIDPFVLAAAQQRGTDLHVLFGLRMLAAANLGPMPVPPPGILGKYYDGIEKFARERKPRPIRVEETSVIEKLGVAGTLDYNGFLDDEYNWILDLKTGPPRAVHSVQLHAYKRMAGHEKVKRIGSLYITRDGNYHIVEHTTDHVDWAAFLAANSTLHWRRMRKI